MVQPKQNFSKPFTVYRSSAGSGKTYTLTREYLSLALKEPHYFKTILAVTFTNKATQEMKSRIIETLYDLSQGNDHAMRAELQVAVSLNHKELTLRAGEVLSAILHNYSHFAVSTIDSFFQRVVRSFAKEVGLKAGFKIELDQPKVLDALIDELLNQVGTVKSLTKWLTQFSEEQLDEGKHWDIRGAIKQLAYEIFSEAYNQHEASLAQLAKDPQYLGKILGQLKQLRSDFEEQMERFGQEGLKSIEEAGLSVEDFAYNSGGPAGYFLNILTEKKDYTPKTRLLVAHTDPEKWSTKKSKHYDTIVELAESRLNPLVTRILSYYDEHFTTYNTAIEVLRNIYTLGILANFSHLLSQYRDRQGVMLVSDAALFLRDIIAQNDTPFIYEKTGAYYQNFLIDEFQDTSGFQWQNFKPLVANAVAAGNKNLVVGDIKQSIYRWRGGNWKLLLEGILQDIGHQNSELIPLNNNWRSCPLIIDFNNSLFYRAAHELKNNYLSKIAEQGDSTVEQALAFEAEHITQAYADVSQMFPIHKSSEPCGLIKLKFLNEQNEELSWKEQAHEEMLATIRQLQDSGYQPRDITILVRSNREGKALADILMAAEQQNTDNQYCYRVISSDALYIDSAKVVGVLLKCLKVLNNPADAISRVNLAYDYQQYILNNKVDFHTLFSQLANSEIYQEKWGYYLPAGFTQQLAALSRLPLYELIESLIVSFGLNKLKGEWAYLQAFQDAILQYSLDEQGDLNHFLNWWQETGSKKTVQVSEGVNAIRIYTVHTSKGLQFKAVLMPYCQWELNHKPTANNIIWSNAQLSIMQDISAVPVKYASRLQHTHFAQNYYREMLQAYMDNLNLLYVAFTRAENCLWACLPQPKSSNSAQDYINSLLLRLLSGQDQATTIPENYLTLAEFWNDESKEFTLGRLDALPKQKTTIEEDKGLYLKEYASSSWRNRLIIRRRSATLVLAKDEKQANQLNWSRTLHAILEKLTYPKELENALETVYYEGLLTQLEMPAVKQQIKAILEHPKAKDWFSENWEVKTELPLLNSKGILLQPDRVITSGNMAVAIDFVTEQPKPHHEYRVRQYLQLLNQMHYKQVKGYIFWVGPGEITEVPSKNTGQTRLTF